MSSFHLLVKALSEPLLAKSVDKFVDDVDSFDDSKVSSRLGTCFLRNMSKENLVDGDRVIFASINLSSLNFQNLSRRKANKLHGPRDFSSPKENTSSLTSSCEKGLAKVTLSLVIASVWKRPKRRSLRMGISQEQFREKLHLNL